MQNNELNEEWFLENGFKKFDGVIPSYAFDVKVDEHNFKQLSFMYNNDTSTHQYYAWFRDGNPKQERHKDDVVCLRKDIQYTYQVKALISALIYNNNEIVALNNWINIKDNPPAYEQEVICWNGVKSVMAIYNGIYKDGADGAIQHNFKIQKYPMEGERVFSSQWANVTHWMPSPEKPKK